MPALASDSTHLAARVAALADLLALLAPVPSAWLAEHSSASSGASPEMQLLTCEDYRTLIGTWRKALRWIDGLDCALSVMLASVVSTRAVGDQLWFKIIGPASCGKSTLCEAISVNQKYVLAKSTIRGFHSGWSGSGEEDSSLVTQIRDKTLVTKDGDTLLKSPNLGQILSEARDIYDSTSRSHYRNGMGKDHTGVRMTWLLCGTSSLRQIDDSDLGERFLDCVIMEDIDDDLEDEILWRIANRAARNVAIEANGKADTQYDPDMVNAMAITGGYVSFLRENANELLAAVNVSERNLFKCARLGKFVAYMRARPSKQQDESQEREFAGRLVSQHTRLATCLAAVLNKDTVDEEVMRRVHKVAMDTARGFTLKILKKLYATPEGHTAESIALTIRQTEDRTRNILRFLHAIGVVEINKSQVKNGVRIGTNRWALTARLRKLYEQVKEDA